MFQAPDQTLIAQLFGTQPDSVVWFQPLYDTSDNEKQIIDFEAKYCNEAASKILGASADKVIGTTLKTSALMDKASREAIFEQCLNVWREEGSIEFTYHSPGFDKYFNVQRSKVMNGILSITRDRTQEVKAELAREQQTLLLNKVLNSSPTGIMLCQVFRKSADAIDDFVLLMVNDKIVNDFNRSREEILQKTFCNLYPEIRENGLLDILIHVVEAGKSFKEEVYFETFGGWFLLTADKVDEDKILVIFLSINETKEHQKKLVQQAQWYNDVFKYSSNGIIAIQSVRDSNDEITDFEIKLANPAGIKMGNLPDNAVGKKLGELLPQIRTGYFDLHKKVVETGDSFRGLLPFNNGVRDGWYQVSLSKLGDGLVSNFMDVTELKEQEKTILEQAQLLDLILNSSLNGVYMLKAVRNEGGEVSDFEITHVNDILCKQSGMKKENLLGKSYLDTFPYTRELGMFNRNCEVLKSGKSQHLESNYKTQGMNRWYESSITKVRDDKLVIAYNDITELKNTTVRLETLNHELSKSNERLSEFTYIASHDLSEPLRKIVTYTSLLNEKPDALAPHIRGYLEKINKTTARMQALISDLLIYSQISTSIQEFECVSLDDIIQEVQNDLEALILQKGAKLVVNTLPSVVGDKTQLRQIFQNLISNAIKFRKENDPAEVFVLNKGETYRQGSAYLSIEIRDNGIGFDESNKSKIFQLFQRLHGRHQFEGTGIGLAIVLKAMENHNGYVEVRSKVGEGSSFILFFPKE